MALCVVPGGARSCSVAPQAVLPVFAFALLVIWPDCAVARHLDTRPFYSPADDASSLPSLQLETRVGGYLVRARVIPAFPQPGELAKIKVHASAIVGGQARVGDIEFYSREHAALAGSDEHFLGRQRHEDGVYRQSFTFPEAGDYIISARFEQSGMPYRVDFPVAVGGATVFAPIAFAVLLGLLVLVSVDWVMRRQGQLDDGRLSDLDGP